MPFFKKKEDRSGRIQELEAHVRNIRRIAAEDPKGAGALQSFLVEDGYWDTHAAALEAATRPTPAPKAPPPANQPPAPPPVARMVGAEPEEQPAQPRSEDEEMLEAELQRYLARIAEETEPEAGSGWDPEDDDR